MPPKGYVAHITDEDKMKRKLDFLVEKIKACQKLLGPMRFNSSVEERVRVELQAALDEMEKAG